MVDYGRKVIFNSMAFIIILQTELTGALNRARYQREPLFDGVLPQNTSYYFNFFESLPHIICAIKCCTNDPICVGYLYSPSLMHCRLLRIFLGESEKANNYNGSGWEYRSIEVNNVALDKEVSSSSIPPWIANTTLQASVDGITNTSTWTELFQTNFEHHPWITIDLGGLAVIKNVVLYNRKDDHGHWLHNVEIRVGNSFTWSEMEFCGLFVGPSQTGKVHTIECGALLYGTYVTAKMIELNYISNDPNANGGRNALVLEEIVVNGFFV